ncbi:MAG: major capsid protein [Syntrophobacteraceae bacterium]
MDNLFKTRTLTTAINAMKKPGGRIYQTHFQPKLNWQHTSRIAWDIISGSEKVLRSIRVDVPADIGEKTNRRTITMESPRMAEKRLINNYDILDMRRYGELGPELLKTRIAREQMDHRNKFDRTLEFWASKAIKGKVYDRDMTTILVDYNLPGTHNLTLLLTDRWSESGSKPIQDIREWKRTIEQDSSHSITGWKCWCGWKVMDCLLANADIRELIKYGKGVEIAETGRISNLVGIAFDEYNETYIDESGVKKPFVEPNEITLIGLGDDVFDSPYLSAVSDDEMTRQLFFSNSWVNDDPKGRWIYGETRTVPVLKRPDAIVTVKVCDAP